MRIGIAGCGRIAEAGYVPAAQAAPGVEIVAFADPDRERLDRCRAQWARGGAGANGFGSVADMLEGARIDLLVVAAPVAAHLALAEEAAAAGVRALIEKPPATSLEEARRLVALTPEPLVAFNRRFLQGAELRDRVPADGWLELDLELRFQRAGWAAHEARDEALLDAGVHLIDLACHLSGAAPVAVRRAEVGFERARVELELSRGRARISCATDRRYRERVEVRDRGGKLLARGALGQVRGRLARLRGAPDPLVLSLTRQLAALRDTAVSDSAFVLSRAMADKGRTPLASATDGATAMAVVEAARRSSELDGAQVIVEPLAEVAG